ncbi:unnamed protein product [Didymodactylos carnosus]|uniref:Uncharacterized protein n=1 Tax=Didymodactylos carnosus TaxID=1234261 RepID=A0A814XHU8_9BILA|nr:unnamed protein product [Didymodactylos carnosus]CAF1211322.1 unnamed protein product [Didymodactylos carnosus]CAF3915605.1 unnamed protein product [Didymodactylos carnosus]CAF3975287.1 unnamed protein product [Didymodactylos carnosus]
MQDTINANNWLTQDDVSGNIVSFMTAGSVVHADVYSVHYDCELRGPDDPYTFVPVRHKTKRHPMAYLPSGADLKTNKSIQSMDKENTNPVLCDSVILGDDESLIRGQNTTVVPGFKELPGAA